MCIRDRAESDKKTYILVAHNGIARVVQSYFCLLYTSLRGTSHYQGAVWDDSVFGDKASGADDAVAADFSSVKNYGAHSD